jgi:hypothetical protein
MANGYIDSSVRDGISRRKTEFANGKSKSVRHQDDASKFDFSNAGSR